ncbi:hypothetical protein [Paenibacillus sp. CF384]|uniref:hypothetical protein n=1 Tax=Paenibacillus sp. CF384 TaxID=1884382 RepID=UPI00089AF9BC|nr:hypothetical protein [Paenibacillus sp. CF384]SDX88682.1 hypothetical protein SAMN05518855_102663 [Paenibacillus sp. CF384]
MKQTTEVYEQLSEKVKAFADRQHMDSYRLIDACRNPRTGLYGDAYFSFGSNPEQMCSVAATGVGLISLCVADHEGWDDQAAEKVKLTLNAALGHVDGCRPTRDESTGFFAHFIDMDSGNNDVGSEISTIDTTLLVTGALFAGQHFKEKAPEIDAMAHELLDQIDWRVVIADKDKGIINMIVKDGKGIAPLPAFNEYVMVAYLAKLAEPDHQDIAELWDNTFAVDQITNYPQKLYRDIPVITDTNTTDNHLAFLSSFVHQFPYYLVPDYAKSEVYNKFYENACLADRLKWKELSDVPSYVWGYGAGANDGLYNTYHADKINDSPGNVASAYIIAGFLPVYPAGIHDMYAMYQLHIPYDVYTNPQDPEDEAKFKAAYKYGVHRFSWWHLEGAERWYPEKVTVIDWSSMLYGMTAFKRGMSFFTDRLK